MVNTPIHKPQVPSEMQDQVINISVHLFKAMEWWWIKQNNPYTSKLVSSSHYDNFIHWPSMRVHMQKIIIILLLEATWQWMYSLLCKTAKNNVHKWQIILYVPPVQKTNYITLYKANFKEINSVQKLHSKFTSSCPSYEDVILFGGKPFPIIWLEREKFIENQH